MNTHDNWYTNTLSTLTRCLLKAPDQPSQLPGVQENHLYTHHVVWDKYVDMNDGVPTVQYQHDISEENKCI